MNRNNRFFGRNWRQVGDIRQHEDVSEILIQQRRDGHHMLLWYWYLIGDVSTGNNRDAKLEQMRQRLNGRRDARVVAIAVRCSSDSLDLSQCDAAEAEAARAALGALKDALMKANGISPGQT